MTATEMHDLLRDSLVHIAHEASLFQPGKHDGTRSILYCRFCGYSASHVSDHGHGDKCLYARLYKVVRSESESE